MVSAMRSVARSWKDVSSGRSSLGAPGAEPKERDGGTEMRMIDSPTVAVETVIEADPEPIEAIVRDLEAMGSLGTEFQGGEWVTGRPGELGSTFVGRQRMGDREWQSTSTVVVSEPGRAFGWAVGDPDDPAARWTFTLRPVADGTEVRYEVVIGPGESGLTAAIATRPEAEETIIDRRLRLFQDNMVKTLEGIRSRVEVG